MIHVTPFLFSYTLITAQGRIITMVEKKEKKNIRVDGLFVEVVSVTGSAVHIHPWRGVPQTFVKLSVCTTSTNGTYITNSQR